MAARIRVPAGRIELACQVSGSEQAPPMVLLHGLGERGADWDPVAGRLAERFRVFAFDLRGHGDSDWPGEYSFRLMRDDVLAAVDGLGLDRVTLVGHSMGGAVGYLVAMTWPGRVAALVVEDASPPYPRERPLPARPPGPLPFDWAVVPAIGGQVNAGDPAAWDGLAAITAPTLIIGGGAASHVAQEMLAAAAARIPRCDLVAIPAGHLVHQARPGRFADVALGWLAGAGPA